MSSQPSCHLLLPPPAFSGLETGEREFGGRKFLLGPVMLMRGASSREHLSESKRNQKKGMSGRRSGDMKENRRQDSVVPLFALEVLK